MTTSKNKSYNIIRDCIENLSAEIEIYHGVSIDEAYKIAEHNKKLLSENERLKKEMIDLAGKMQVYQDVNKVYLKDINRLTLESESLRKDKNSKINRFLNYCGVKT